MAVAALTSPEDIINAALAKIGYRRRVGSIWEGSDASKVALDVYAQTRDDIMRTNDWGFARRDATLTLQKSAPPGGYAVTPWNPNVNPAPPYSYQYAYPSDSLRIRAIRNADPFLVNYDPRDHLFTVANDETFTPAQKVVLTDVGPVAIATYSAQITDPAQMDADFVEVLIDAMGKRLGAALEKLDASRMAEQDELRATAEADTTQSG